MHGIPTTVPKPIRHSVVRYSAADPAHGGEYEGLEHYKWSLASSILMFGDRLWNHSVCDDIDTFGIAASRWALGIDTPPDFNMYKDFGGFMQPRSVDGTRMWADRAASDLTYTYEVLKAIAKPHTYTGRLAGEYVLSVEWLNEKRKENK